MTVRILDRTLGRHVVIDGMAEECARWNCSNCSLQMFLQMLVKCCQTWAGIISSPCRNRIDRSIEKRTNAVNCRRRMPWYNLGRACGWWILVEIPQTERYQVPWRCGSQSDHRSAAGYPGLTPHYVNIQLKLHHAVFREQLAWSSERCKRMEDTDTSYPNCSVWDVFSCEAIRTVFSVERQSTV